MRDGLVQLGGTQQPAPREGVSRRDLLQLMGTSLALAGAQGCIRDEPLQMEPYRRQPADLVPGNPLHYATTLVLGGLASPVLVTAREGRPIKIEGNPDHPQSRGATGLLEQAALYSLYDPDRARASRKGGAPLSWAAVLRELAQLSRSHERDGGARLRFLLEPDASPLLADLRGQIQARFPKARFHAHAAIDRDNALDGAQLAFGRRLAQSHDLRAADVVLSLDADFLSPHRGPLHLLRDFADRRVPALGKLNRLYAIESTLSLTGISADHRYRVRPEEVSAVALMLLARLGSRVAGLGPIPAPPRSPVPAEVIDRIARDLAAHAGASAVLVGDEQPPEVHALGAALNAALGNLGHTVRLHQPPLSQTGGTAALAELLAELRAGAVDTLVCTAWNPVYSMPADAGFGALWDKLGTSVYLGGYEDETAARSALFVHRAHELESWGDGRAHDGTVSLQQPLIAPLTGGVQEAQLLAAFVGQGDRSPRELLETSRRKGREREFASSWPRALQLGMIKDSALPAEPGQLDAAAVAGAARRITELLGHPQPQGLSLRLMPSPTVFDGRFANNAWLQELPDPVSLVTWDNAAWMSAATLRTHGLQTGDVVQLSLGGRSVRATALLIPGMPEETVALHLGYGRSGTAETTAKQIGTNAFALRSLAAPWFAEGLTLAKTGDRHDLAIAQEHSRMEDRDAAKILNVAELAAGAPSLDEARKRHESLYDQQPVVGPLGSQGYQWGMAIDLSRCIGCSACVMACEAENNGAVVGREEMMNGRRMHWLRVDRYFTGGEENPGAVFQPVACVHCEHAPCEYVCPVNATVHSDEGLNEMIYNRCVGTRYCSNNCPYKVRRFNFYNWWIDTPEKTKLSYNPDVTVRARGVMEKCSYCVQRIERARIDARSAGRRIQSAEVATACQQTCPTSAIVFGDIADRAAEVTKLREDARAYALLDDLGTLPRTRHLARVRNPNPELG
jgi:Fe-S-cluster-containing dehydrogenase component